MAVFLQMNMNWLRDTGRVCLGIYKTNGDNSMSKYNLKKILDNILEQMDENEEGREYIEEVKELYEFIYELNSKKQVNNVNKEIEDVIQNYIIEWAVWGVAMIRKDIPQRLSLVYSGFCFQISNTILGKSQI